MSKRYHPCYTNVNPAADARKYTSERVYYRKVTLEYDWLPPGREVESWFRRVPYRLERGEMEGSWIVKYFEFRAGIAPVPQLGFIGDLWISWNARDPSVWFKVEDMNWERWGGCVSSIHEVSSSGSITSLSIVTPPFFFSSSTTQSYRCSPPPRFFYVSRNCGSSTFGESCSR